MHSNRKKVIYTAVIAVLLVAVFGIIYFSSTSKITTDVSKMVDNAKKLYSEGDIENASYQMQLYCQERPDDSEGWMILGDYCIENKNSEKAYEYYKKAAQHIDCGENSLSESDKVKSFENFSSIESVKIYPSAKYTKDMTLVFSGENLTPAKSEKGRINGNSSELKADDNYLTTDWFTVDDSKKYVYITGNINCAEWQFIDSNDYYTRYVDESSFRVSNNTEFVSKSYSFAEIPNGAQKARVTYYDKSITDTVKSDSSVFIGYGKSISGFTTIKKQSFDIPDLSENQYIEYKNGKWALFDGEKTSDLGWDKLTCFSYATVSIDGTLCGATEITYKNNNYKKADKSLQYGIKFNKKSEIASGERLGAAKGMNFDYKVGNEWYNGTGNDFDNAYPWCEMKLCNVKVDSNGNEVITMENEKGFKKDGSNGNVMVRIPKFYSMRIVRNDCEYLWISGTEHNGYSVDPIFEKSDGSYADYVYMSAYLGAEKDNKIVSTSESYPTLLLTYGTTLEYAQNNGDGFSEMNFLMCQALQKLFVIETGTIDSSSVFAGDTSMYYYYDTKNYETSGYAAEDAKSTNTIRLYNNYNTIKICKGSSIAIFNSWKSYKNNNGTQREVTDIKSTEDYIDVTFDGKPVNIQKHKTIISNIPAKTGKTDSIDYCSGTLEGNKGKVSFKYRNIENLYGSALIMLDNDAYVQNGNLCYYSGSGVFNTLSTPVAEQSVNLSNYDEVNTKMCVKEMTYDESNPLIMVPSVTGKGASVYGYYGDIWTYKNDESEKYILYGGADDNSTTAGIFQMRAIISGENTSLSFFSSRIIYK